jgi:hypothetical protein
MAVAPLRGELSNFLSITSARAVRLSIVNNMLHDCAYHGGIS